MCLSQRLGRGSALCLNSCAARPPLLPFVLRFSQGCQMQRRIHRQMYQSRHMSNPCDRWLSDWRNLLFHASRCQKKKKKLRFQQQKWQWCDFHYLSGPVGRPSCKSQKFKRFPFLIIICLWPCSIDYFSCSASALSSYNDQIARGQTTTPAISNQPTGPLWLSTNPGRGGAEQPDYHLTVGCFLTIWMALLSLKSLRIPRLSSLTLLFFFPSFHQIFVFLDIAC